MTEIEDIVAALKELQNGLKALLKKERNKLKKQESELEEAGEWEVLSHWADTLLANRNDIKKGMKEALLENVHTGEIEEIKLNPKCTVDKNAELLYKKARRGKRGYETCLEKVAETESSIEGLQEYLDRSAHLFEDGIEFQLGVVEKFLEEVKPVVDGKKVASSNRPKDHDKSHPFRHYQYRGYDIYAGKTSEMNDELSIKFAKPSDIWFHAVGYAGSHVIIRRPKNAPMPPKDVIEVAGGISVFFSKAKHTSYAEVHMTEARFVRKPRKSPAGLVTAERCKTLRMTPVDPQKLFKDEKEK